MITAIFVIAQMAVLPACIVYDARKTRGFKGRAGEAEITANMRSLFAAHPALEPPNIITIQTVDVVYLYVWWTPIYNVRRQRR